MSQLLNLLSLGYIADLPLIHLLLWSGLVALTVLVIVVVVTRWGKSRPLQTCAILSLLAHFLLACLATIVRIVAGFDQVAEGPPIRVCLVQDIAAPVAPPPTKKHDPLPTPPLPDTKPGSSLPLEGPKAPQTATTSVITQPPQTTTKTAPQPTPPPDVPNVFPDAVTTQPPVAAAISDDAHPTKNRAPPATSPDGLPAVPKTAPKRGPSESGSALETPQPVRKVPAPPEPATPYANRKRPDRLGFVEREGGSRETEASVRAALVWLAAAQSPDGRWNANRFGAGEERAVLGHHRSGAGSQADTGITGLALLAYLGAGYTHLDGPYGETVRQGLQFLVNSQAPDGNLSGKATVYARMYCHSMATFALAEAMAITGDPLLEPTVRRAVNYSLVAQNPATGGWRYRAGDSGDTSQLGWKVMALRSAERAGIAIPPKTWTSIERFLRAVASGHNGGLASYQPHDSPSRTMTAEALYCHQLLAETAGGQVNRQTVNTAATFICQEQPGQGIPNFYYWYYATLALHHQKQHTDASLATWHQWNRALKRTLLKSQVGQGPEAGSWPSTTVWGGYGGRVFTTSLASLCLEVYYRYAPTPENRHPWVASGSGPQEFQR